MSKTFKIEKPLGFGYRRPSKGCLTASKKHKQLTHRLERRAAVRGIHSELDEVAA
jgi:hypothetical protein